MKILNKREHSLANSSIIKFPKVLIGRRNGRSKKSKEKRLLVLFIFGWSFKTNFALVFHLKNLVWCWLTSITSPLKLSFCNFPKLELFYSPLAKFSSRVVCLNMKNALSMYSTTNKILIPQKLHILLIFTRSFVQMKCTTIFYQMKSFFSVEINIFHEK